jgi:CCR4-NOT transcription complex subunit 4
MTESDVDSKGSCPACRKPYTDNPANFKPLSVEDVQQKLKQRRKQKDQQKKAKTVDSRKHLQDLRVVQRNLVFVVGIPQRIADADKLKKIEFFGKFGKIVKIVVNSVTGGSVVGVAGQQVG